MHLISILPNPIDYDSEITCSCRERERERERVIHVFPNPANDYTIVSYNMEGIGVMELLSHDGRLIRSEYLKPGKKQYLLRTDGLSSGVYTLNLKGGNKVLTTKLVIR
jgi:hypothetical protein